MRYKLKILLISILFILSFPSIILSAEVINIIGFPASKNAGEEFEISFDASGLSNSSIYYMKGLGGGSGSALTEVDTWNNGWFQQNGAWTSMPTFSVNAEGSASASIKLRFDQGVSTATKDIKLRIRKNDSDKNIDSSTVAMQVTYIAPPPTEPPTTAPTTSPTKAPTAVPTTLSTIKPTPLKTGTPRPTSTTDPTDEPDEVNESDSTPQPTGLVAGAKSENKSPLLAIFFVVTGIGCLGYVGYLFYDQKYRKNKKLTDS